VARRVVITGAGIVSPLGDSPAAVHEALCAGRVRMGPVTLFPTDGLGSRPAAEIPSFAPQAYLGDRNLRPLDRTAQLAASAAALALADAGWTGAAREGRELGLVLGTQFGSVRTIAEFDRRALTAGPEYASPMDFANTVINAAAGQTAIVHGLRGVNSTIAAGAASGLQAVAYGADLVRAGRATALLAGGAEELSFEALYGFARAGRLAPGGDGPPVPFAPGRRGFALGEGAALVVLEDADEAAARGARVLGEVLGHGWAYGGRAGEAVARDARAHARAVGRALEAARLAPQSIDLVGAGANGSVAGDLAEASGLRCALGERARAVPVTAPKAGLGEALGAAGAMQVVVLLESIRSRFVPGIPGLDRVDPEVGLAGARSAGHDLAIGRALVSAASGDGYCGALVLGAPS